MKIQVIYLSVLFKIKYYKITNLLFVIKTRQPLKQNFMLNCKKTMIKKKEWL